MSRGKNRARRVRHGRGETGTSASAISVDAEGRGRESAKTLAGAPVDRVWVRRWIEAATLLVLVLYTTFAGCQVLETRRGMEAVADQFALAERPWLHAELRVIEDLTFDESGVGSVGVEVVLSNSGNSPAMNARVVQFLTADIMDAREIDARAARFCEPLRTQEVQAGHPVFPGATETVSDKVYIRRDAIDEGATRNARLWIDSPEGLAQWKGKIAPSLFTCIDYRSAMFPAKHYQTRYYSVVGPKPDAFSAQTALAPVGTFSDTQLWRIFVGQYAD
jgi:hypothetical protein